jgi:ABC-type antimicrobial peptide transport system permease subunit
VLKEGATIAAIGVVVGTIGGLALARFAGGFISDVRLPGTMTMVGAAFVLVGAALLASLIPAARAARVDVVHALRPE